jgi:3'(2'), 5'-bisphosphate nucleotidase
MNNPVIENLLYTALKAAVCAGKEMMNIYNTDFRIDMKKNKTPITEADRISNKMIFEYIDKFSLPVISEEGKCWDYNERKNWEYFWLVDPLDGTKEFVNRNGEFTVNIALIKKNSPIIGVIYAPVTDVMYFAAEEKGAFKLMNASAVYPDKTLENYIKKSEQLPRTLKRDEHVIVASRSHMNPETEKYIEDIKKQFPETKFISKGSSLKLCMIAEGVADIYPRLSPTMEWDIAAGHAIIRYSGGKIKVAGKEEELQYNKPDLRNSYFIASR